MSEAHLFAIGILLAWLSGIRVYLTVFGLGVAGAMGWLDLPPALHVAQLPPMHTMLAPQLVPFGRLPDSAQTGEPVEHVVAPVLHTLPGWQAEPAAHAPHAPALQTRSGPQLVPLARLLPVSLQPMVGEQTVTPAWHELEGTHAGPAVQATQAPAWQTRPVPHTLPLG